MIKYYFILTLLLTPLTAFSGDSYHTHPYIPIEPEVVPQVATVPGSVVNKGIALGIASAQTQHDFGTHKWQWSAGYGYYDSNDAISLSIAKRVDRVLINGSVGREGSETGYGVGISGRF